MDIIGMVVDGMVAKWLAGDLELNRTCWGGYRPTLRVCLQRQWGDDQDRALALAKGVHPSAYMERAIVSATIDFADLEPRARHEAHWEFLRRAERIGLHAVPAYRDADGRIQETTIKTPAEVEDVIKRAFPLYIERLEAAATLAHGLALAGPT